MSGDSQSNARGNARRNRRAEGKERSAAKKNASAANSKRNVKQPSAEILKWSRPGRFARASTSPPAAMHAPSQRAAIHGPDRNEPGVLRVLIVDDHELVRRGLAALLNAERDLQACGEVPCGESVLEAVRTLRPDVVLVDVSSSHSAGLETIQRIRKSKTGARIVALVMTDRPELVERVYEAGAAAFAIKTGVAERVLQAIRGHARPGAKPAATPAAPAGATPRAGAGRLDRLERSIMEHIGRGAPSQEIAMMVGASVAEVRACRRRLLAKLSCESPTQLVELCARWASR